MNTMEANAAIDTSHALYQLEVLSDNMQAAGIRRGDMIYVKRCSTAGNGDLVVVKLNGELLLRYYSVNGPKIQLLSAENALAPIEVDTRYCRFEVWGRVV